MVRYEHDRYSLFAAQLRDGLDDLAPALGVEHRRRLVKHYDLGLHCDDSRDGDALFLSAGQEVRCVHLEFVHIDLPERLIHSLAYLRRCNSQILRSEGHVILNDVCDYLVIGVLEHHSHGAPDIQKPVLIGGIDAVYEHLALGGQKYCV